MSFVWPAMLLLLLAIPIGVAGYVTLERRRRRRVAASSFMPATTASADATRGRRARSRVPAALILVGLTILVVALARPQSVVGVPRIEGTVVLAFDVSGSMAATDLQPTRMEAAKAAARKFVERQPSSVLIGVVAFSDSGLSTQVPTRDQSLVLAAINRLKPERATAIGLGINASLAAIAAADADPASGFYTNRSPDPTPEPTPVPAGEHAPAAIVLLTDGENTVNPDPLQAAQAAADRGVRVYTVGIGSPEGTNLQVEGGFTVHSQLDEDALRGIADLTGGTYYSADNPDELTAVYDHLDTHLVVRSEAMEVTSLFAGAAVLVLVAGAVTSLFWLGRVP
ncbi:MAG: VWA domain-containing protein [Chloroflexota bacterium]